MHITAYFVNDLIVRIAVGYCQETGVCATGDKIDETLQRVEHGSSQVFCFVLTSVRNLYVQWSSSYGHFLSRRRMYNKLLCQLRAPRGRLMASLRSRNDETQLVPTNAEGKDPCHRGP
jgi:hypothetical protein